MKKGLIIAVNCLFVLFSSIPLTHASTPPALSAALKQGVSGSEVAMLQQRLKDLGYYEDDVDGVFGSDTAFAVVSFQSDAGLEPDGVVGKATWTALRDFKPEAVSRGLTELRKGQQLVAFARKFLGVPYVWAGRSPSGFDCSGYITYIFDRFGVQLPRMADEQFEAGVSVNLRELQPGDLVFFSTYEPGPSHVGIYIGSGQFIHASSGANEVTITPLTKAYYQERYLGARRVLR